MRRTIGLVLVCSLMAVASVAVAQPSTVPAGSRVRVSLPPSDARGPRPARYLSGNPVGADDSTLVLRFDRNPTEYRVSVLPTTVLELSAGGSGTHAGRGALIGLFT